MKVHTRMVIDADPEVKQMAIEIKNITGDSLKRIIKTLIRQDTFFLLLKTLKQLEGS